MIYSDNWIVLDSTKIRKVKFLPNKHDRRGDLLVEFNEGKIYAYKDVPLFMLSRMVHSNDPSEYFVNNIRNAFQLSACHGL